MQTDNNTDLAAIKNLAKQFTKKILFTQRTIDSLQGINELEEILDQTIGHQEDEKTYAHFKTAQDHQNWKSALAHWKEIQQLKENALRLSDPGFHDAIKKLEGTKETIEQDLKKFIKSNKISESKAAIHGFKNSPHQKSLLSRILSFFKNLIARIFSSPKTLDIPETKEPNPKDSNKITFQENDVAVNVETNHTEVKNNTQENQDSVLGW